MTASIKCATTSYCRKWILETGLCLKIWARILFRSPVHSTDFQSLEFTSLPASPFGIFIFFNYFIIFAGVFFTFVNSRFRMLLKDTVPFCDDDFVISTDNTTLNTTIPLSSVIEKSLGQTAFQYVNIPFFH